MSQMTRRSLLPADIQMAYPIVGFFVAACVISFGWSDSTVWALTITMPAQGSHVSSGRAIPVAVEPAKDVNLRGVKYYWYRGDDEPLPSHQADPARFIAAAGGQAFSGTIDVPADAIGTMRLVAVGEVTRGRLAGHEDFDEILVTVEPVAALTAIEFSVRKPWRLDTIGKRLPVPAVGQFQDGVLRPLNAAAGTRFRSSDNRVVQVSDDGVLQVKGNGKAMVTVETRGKIGTVDVVVEADAEQNREPIAQVTPELSVKAGTVVVLDGLQSHDPDGDPLRYEWKQIRGHRVSLTTVNEAKATFVAPSVSERKRFQFSLVVTDMAGPDVMKGADSAPAVVTVWVSP
jgi:hypothetical protein